MYILFIFLYSLCSLYYLMILHLSVPNPRFAEPQSSFPVSHVGCNASVKGLRDSLMPHVHPIKKWYSVIIMSESPNMAIVLSWCIYQQTYYLYILLNNHILLDHVLIFLNVTLCINDCCFLEFTCDRWVSFKYHQPSFHLHISCRSFLADAS